MCKPEPIEIEVCQDCINYIANGEVPPELELSEIAKYQALIEDNWPVECFYLALGGTGLGFSHEPCDCCGSSKFGQRYQAFAMPREGRRYA